jgi:transposase-like protein
MLKSIKKTPVKPRRQFDETFKQEAVNNWLASGKSASVIAQELGINPERLYAWRNRYAPPDLGESVPARAKPNSPAALQGQLDAALREIRHLREQRDILKKTLGIISEPLTNATRGLIS